VKWIGQHIFDLIARFRNDVYISENLTIGSDADIEPKINILNDENSVEIGIANATNDMVTGSADGDLVINSVGDHKIILAQNDAEVITIEDNTNVSFANDVFLNGDMLTVSSGASTGGRLRLYEGTDNGTNTLTLNAPAAITTDTDLVLPDGFGSSGQVLTTDGNNPAALSWTTPTTGDITGVTITTDSGGGSAASDTSGSADFSILGSSGVGVTNSGTTITAVAVPAEIDHDSLSNFVAAEHYDWSSDISGTATVHTNNITDLHGAGVDGSANQLLTDDGDGSVSSEAKLTWDGSSTLTLGGDVSAVMNIKRHAMSTANGSSMTVYGGDATDGQTNKTGGDLTLQSGLGTGTGARGTVYLKSGKTESSGTDLQSATFSAQFSDGVFENTTGYGFREKINFVTDTFEDVLADGDHTGSKVLVYGADESLTDGQLYFLHTDGSWDQADASAVSTGASQLLGVGNGRTVSAGVILEGFIRVPSTEILNTPGSGAVDGLPVYVSTTAGHFDFTAPSGNNEFVRVVGYAIDDDSSDVLVYFNPDRTWVKITA
jgi:hypothetical protein